MKTGNRQRHLMRLRFVFLISVFILAVAVLAVPFYSVRSNSVPAGSSSAKQAQASLPRAAALVPWAAKLALPMPMPVSSPEAIYTFASDCTTPKTDWNLGETVCAKANGVPVSLFPWRVLLIDPAGFVRQSQDAIADDNATYTFILPSSPTTTVNGQVVDNRGSWRVELVRSNGARRQSAVITVHQAANPVADVFVQKTGRDGDATVSVGGSIAFLLVVANAGPDTAQSVHLIDSTPSGSTLVSFTQQSGPACLPASTSNCTMASLANGERAEFTAIYLIGGSPGDVLTTATVSSTTTDSNSDNNSSTAQFTVATGGTASQCSLICPTSLVYSEDSPGSGGKTVAANAFPAPTTTGTCGAVSTSAVPNPQTNNYFFPVGVSVITASTESGEECTFTVTVTDNQNPTINCPGDITTFESSPGSGSANVNFNVTASDNSGTANITCTHQSGDSFATGTPTQVTCTATDETNNTATCSFNVTVTGINSTCVLTTQPPIVVDSPDNACGANVTFTTPTSDGSGTCGTITCDHQPGFFPVGDTLVTCTSSPDGANTSFTVTVRDVTLPVPDLGSLPTITRDCTATAGIPTPTVIQTPTGPVTIIVNEPPTATDNCGGRIAGATDDPRTYQEAGTFIVHWNYTDASGNSSTQTQTIVVTGDDTSPPTITAPGPVSFNTGPTSTSCGVTIADLDVALGQAIANDSCSVADVERTGVPAGNEFPVGQTTVTYTATDASGHTASATQVVTVVDNTLPVLTAAPGPVTLYTGAGATSCGVTVTDLDATLGTATAHDNCAFTVTRLGLPAGNFFPVGMTIITYKVVDASGNQGATTATQEVTVIDNTPPTITLSGANPQYVECHTSYPELGATANDNCGNFAATPSGTVNVNVPGTYTITYNATDPAGNAATPVTRTVIVQDTIAPTITLNSYAPSMWPPNHDYRTFQVTAFVTAVTDSCDTSLGISAVVIEKVTSDEAEDAEADGSTLNDIVIAANCKSVQLRAERAGNSNGRVYTITFRVSDASGNITRATAKVVVAHNTGETPVDSGVHYTVNGTCP